MRCLGRVFRPFNPREPNYEDIIVRDFVDSVDESNLYCNYGVVPRRLEHSLLAISRYNRHSEPFSDRIKSYYDIAGDWLEKEFGAYLCDSKVYSLDTVMEWLRPMKSSGYPYTLKYPFKYDYYQSDDFQFYATYWSKLSTTDYVHSLCSVTIKEEVRPIEKIKNGDVRTIVSMDVNHVLAHSQLCLHQNQRLVNTNMMHSSALGLNILQGGFHKAALKLSKFGPRSVLELDGKKFDSRFRAYCFDKIRDFRFKMLSPGFRTPENFRRLFNLYKELSSAPLVNVDGFVFDRDAGNPSGQASTTPDNTFKNFMDWVVLWHLIMPVGMHSYHIFKENIVLLLCGDDSDVGVNSQIHDLFNYETISKVQHEIDMEYHAAAPDFLDVGDSTFLGHRFTYTEIPELGYGMYLPTIDCERMRTNMLIYNEKQTLACTIIRACGLRNETFACESCRSWFLRLINFIRVRYPSTDDLVVNAWKNYLTDRELWEIYSGTKAVNVRKC